MKYIHNIGMVLWEITKLIGQGIIVMTLPIWFIGGMIFCGVGALTESIYHCIRYGEWLEIDL